MKTRHVVAIVIGCLLLLPGIGLLLGGGAVGVAGLAARGDGGWMSVDLSRLESSGVAVTADDLMVRAEGPAGVVTWFDLQARLTARSLDGKPVFVGVAPEDSVHAYLAGAAYDRVVNVDRHGVASYDHTGGAGSVAAPVDQTFWDRSASGAGAQDLTWTLRTGRWAVAILNADGTPGVAVSATAAVRTGALWPIALGLLGTGLVLCGLGAGLIIAGVRGRDTAPLPPSEPHAGTPAGPPDSLPVDDPVRLDAELQPGLSRGLWLVKWIAAFPHLVILVVLWAAFGVLTVVAWFAILFTGRYPRGIFAFNVGVLRWSWRVSYYAFNGGLGTDEYPPFSLDARPGDAARLDIAYPEQLSRGLIFVKWLLLLPHWVFLALVVGTSTSWVRMSEATRAAEYQWPGVLGLLVFVAAVILLFTGSYPRPIFDLVIGLNRWTYRVIAYGALMTDVYPPFRLDQGGHAPATTLRPRTT